MSTRPIVVPTAIVGVLMSPAPLFAQEEPRPVPAALEKVADCRSVTDAQTRLACYDKATAELLDQANAGEVSIVSREEAKETRRSLFGFRLPSLGIFKNAEDGSEEEIKSITSTITAVSDYGRGTYRITIERDDAVWVTTEASSFFRKPDVGKSVEITRAALGTFFLSVNGRKRVRARRVD